MHLNHSINFSLISSFEIHIFIGEFKSKDTKPLLSVLTTLHYKRGRSIMFNILHVDQLNHANL